MEKSNNDIKATEKPGGRSRDEKTEKVQDGEPPIVIPFFPFGRFLLPPLIAVSGSAKPQDK